MPDTAPRWTRYLICRTDRTRTTWKLRLALLALAGCTLWLTASWWTAAIERSLICEPSLAPSDAILIENFDSDYILFERARELRRAGAAPRVLVPVYTTGAGGPPNAVALAITEAMARLSRLGSFDVVAVGQVEPIALNAARDIQKFVNRAGIRSLIVVAPRFRSRRSALVYAATLGQEGVSLRCAPGPVASEVGTWTNTWHGIQNVAEQFVKLQYYRLSVLPFAAGDRRPPPV